MPQRVLIADDEPAMLEALATIVASTGREVVTAHDGTELLQALGEQTAPFDLVITDVSMPLMTGVQAAASAYYAGLQTPLLIVTALRDPGLLTQVQSFGPKVRLLHKPIVIEKLQQAIEELIASPAHFTTS